MADDDDAHTVQLGDHPLFTQMDVLVHFADNTVGWKEISRSAQHYRYYLVVVITFERNDFDVNVRQFSSI